jgi:adenine-specific DNA-methyltransferase
LVWIGDSLMAPPVAVADRFDLVIGNPPYGKLKLSDTIRKKYQGSLFGHPNYYGLFSHLSVDLVRAGGVIALLTPTSFLSGEYFKNLRSLLRQRSAPIGFDFVSFRKGVFEDVLQETMLAVYRSGPDHTASVRVNQLTTTINGGLHYTTAGEFQLPAGLTAPWILPRTPQQSSTVQAMGNMRCTLKDWGYTVSTGPLVWNRHKKQLVGLRAEKQVYPIIWAEAVTADGQFILRAEKRNHQPYFKFQKGDDWLVTTQPCILLQRTTAKEQDKRLIATALPPEILAQRKGVVIENHLNMIIPLQNDPAVRPEVLAAFLNSRATNEAFRTISGSVAVSAYELESLLLPTPEQLTRLAELVRTQQDQVAIEMECAALYIFPR